MFKNLSIKAGLIFVIVQLSLLLIAIGGIGLFGMAKTDDGLKTVYEDRAVPMGQLAEIERRMGRNRLNVATALALPTAEQMRKSADDIEANIAATSKVWEAYMATYLTKEEEVIAKKFAEDRKKTLQDALLPAVKALRANDLKEANRLLAEVIPPHYVQVEQGIAALMQLQLDVAKSEFEQAQSRYATIRNGVIAAIALGVLLAAAMGFLLVRAIVLPLNRAVAVADAVAAGDLTSAIESDSNNETGRLLHALKRMNDKLADLVSQVRSGSEAIGSGSKQIASGNADLSQRTEEQASSLEETASSMEELTSTVKQNAENSKHANQLAVSASEVAVKGGQVVSEVVGTMSSINESSKKIADITGVIDGIAFQTNILALNAAVEAARAGEQGRGFAVVASEVRNLAQRSAAAAKEIKALIGDSVAKVDAGTRLVDDAGKTMQEIVTSVKRVTDIMGEITAASQEQSAGIEQVNQAITQMDEVTQQNAALVEEAAAAAESLEEQARQLDAAVAVFNLGKAGAGAALGRSTQVAQRNESQARPAAERRGPNRALNVARLPARQKAQPAAPKAKLAGAGGEEQWEEF